MLWLILVMLLAIANAHVSSPAKDKVDVLQKQVETLTNLVHALSNVISKSSCQSQGALGSNPASGCFVKVADQAKLISNLDGQLKSLQSSTKRQQTDIQLLQTTVSDLSKKLQTQETTLASLDNKYASEISRLLLQIQSASQKTTVLKNTVTQLQTTVQQNAGQWPSGSYCILASGSCPAGFSKRSGYMKAISLYAGNAVYIKQETFGDSKIRCHGRCGQYGHWTGELHINACCK